MTVSTLNDPIMPLKNSKAKNHHHVYPKTEFHSVNLMYRIYSLIRRTIFYEKICLFDENLLKIRGASYNRVFSRNDCVIQTTRPS